MNIYGVIILAALALEYVLNLVADVLNVRALQTEVPAEFVGVYDPHAYRRSQEYLRVNTRFGCLTASVDLVLLLGFWFSGGFDLLDRLVRQCGFGSVVTGLIFTGALVLLKVLLSLPFSWYSTFVIENRFGFNRTTPRTFVMDILKAAALAILLGGPVLALVLAFLEFAGQAAWLYCWGITTAFLLVLQFIAPVWIMPIFNKFTPLPEGALRDAILAYVNRVRFPVKGLFVMDGSRRSTRSNAFLAGFGRHRRIALFDTLVERHTVPGLVSVIAHEVGHWKKKHILKALVLGIAHAGLMFFLLSVFLTHDGLFDAFFMERRSIYAGLVFFGMLYTPVELLLSVCLHMLSRRNEFAADRFAAETASGPESMVRALKTLSVSNLTNLTPHPLTVFLDYSHPPVLARIRALKAMACRADDGCEEGQARRRESVSFQ